MEKTPVVNRPGIHIPQPALFRPRLKLFNLPVNKRWRLRGIGVPPSHRFTPRGFKALKMAPSAPITRWVRAVCVRCVDSGFHPANPGNNSRPQRPFVLTHGHIQIKARPCEGFPFNITLSVYKSGCYRQIIDLIFADED